MSGREDEYSDSLINQGPTWYQADVDATLPWIESTGIGSRANDRLAYASMMIAGSLGTPFQSFLITFKPDRGRTSSPIDDPIFGAHQRLDNDEHGYSKHGYFADHEVTAIGCTQIFKSCSEGKCVDFADYSWSSLSLPGIMSV